MANTA
ncbi:hypothetical protein D043_2120A, partial [Vibrio parahaemolyticus EKP-021]